MTDKSTQFMGTAQIANIDARRLHLIIDELCTIALGAATSDGRITFDAALTIRLEPDPPRVTPEVTAIE